MEWWELNGVKGEGEIGMNGYGGNGWILLFLFECHGRWRWERGWVWVRQVVMSGLSWGDVGSLSMSLKWAGSAIVGWAGYGYW